MNPALAATFTQAATALLESLGEEVTVIVLGEDATRTWPYGAEMPVRAVLDSDLQAVGDPFSERMEKQWTATVAVSAKVAIGDNLKTATQSWEVTQIIADDGITATLALRPLS